MPVGLFSPLNTTRVSYSVAIAAAATQVSSAASTPALAGVFVNVPSVFMICVLLPSLCLNQAMTRTRNFRATARRVRG
jgi:hypothetical protein